MGAWKTLSRRGVKPSTAEEERCSRPDAVPQPRQRRGRGGTELDSGAWKALSRRGVNGELMRREAKIFQTYNYFREEEPIEAKCGVARCEKKFLCGAQGDGKCERAGSGL